MVNLQLRTREAKVGGGVVSCAEVWQGRTLGPRCGWEASRVWENRGTRHFKGRATMGGNIWKVVSHHVCILLLTTSTSLGEDQWNILDNADGMSDFLLLPPRPDCTWSPSSSFLLGLRSPSTKQVCDHLRHFWDILHIHLGLHLLHLFLRFWVLKKN